MLFNYHQQECSRDFYFRKSILWNSWPQRPSMGINPTELQVVQLWQLSFTSKSFTAAYVLPVSRLLGSSETKHSKEKEKAKSKHLLCR